MEKTFELEIIASDRVFYTGPCESLVFPGIDGAQGVWANHERTVTCVSAGELKYKVDDQWNYAAISDGYAEITGDHVVLIADTVERPEEIDIKRAEEAKARAEEKMRQKQSIMEYYHTQVALNKAMNRLKVNQKHFK
ncbi:MAG: ATP synthase F1 subunit epsilon [Lachnospiraceae bacterium]|jgi:F-type H+-transporting ATPase subunit epsilon|nr:ATP synthase F1 subunit epsilon [Lachnospiraceae bacterium]MCR4802476.1 ATP synthase F1 subunit epsilon [Lachnospiraceae bacterium]